jgi:hypothetical protein
MTKCLPFVCVNCAHTTKYLNGVRHMQKANRLIKILKNPKTVFIGTLACAALFSATGYCDATVNTNEQAINDTSELISKFLFGPTVRKVALTLGMGAGLFQAFMSGSIRPLLVYGGLGLAVCYLPKIVNWISTVG